MTTYRTDQTLKSPLLGTEVVYCLSGTSPLHHHKCINSVILNKPLIPSQDYYKVFLSHYRPPGRVRPLDIGSISALIWKVVARTWSAPEKLQEKISDRIKLIPSNPVVLSILEKHLELQEIITNVSFSQHQIIKDIEFGDLRLSFYQSLVLVDLPTKEQCLITYNHFLAVADTVKSQVLLVIGALVEDAIEKWNIPMLGYVTDFIKFVTQGALRCEHDTYFAGLKSIYSLAQGYVLKHHNKVIKDNFYMVTEEAVGTLSSDLAKMVYKLAAREPVMALELFSVQKAFFFPEIKLKEGVEQQFTRMRRSPELALGLSDFGEVLLGVFRAEYIQGYIRKHAKWPPVKFLSHVRKNVLRAHSTSEWMEPRTWTYSDFSAVELQRQDFVFDMDPDLSDIITDKSIIENKRKWTYEFNRAAYRSKHGSSLNHIDDDPGHKRLIKAYLSGCLDDIPSLIKDYSDGNIHSEDLIAVLVPKEKELKVKGRYFSKQSLKTRIYQVLCELNLKKSIMPLLRTHSMTTGSTQLAHILDKISMRLQRQDAFVINLDYESWCNAFRPEIQMPLCGELDRMFGSGAIYQVGCYIPLATTFLVQDRFNAPRQHEDQDPVEDSETCVHGTLSMGEGMRQKLWTILTGCAELLTLQEMGLNGQVLGQGDNQTLLVMTPHHVDKNLLKTALIERIELNAKKMGHVLKPDECWASDTLYEYGKKMYFKSAPVSNFLKIFSRITDSTGEIFPNIYARLSCLSSSCLSAAQADHTPWPALIASIVAHVLELHILLPRSITKNIQLMCAIALVGPILGGLPSPATLPAVMFRGTADPLTFQLALLQHAIHAGVSSSEIHRVTKIITPSSPSIMALISDPTCLNLIQLRRPERILREWIESSLSEMTESSKLLSLLNMGLTDKAEVLAEDLFSMTPKFPRLMSYLFSNANVAYGLSMIDKFQKSSTIISISQGINMRSLVEESHEFKKKVIKSIEAPNKCGLNILDYLSGCTVHCADRLRFDTWGVKLEGTTFPFIGEQFSMSTCIEPEEIANSILFSIPVTLHSSDITRRGQYPLYLGSRTFVKVNRGAITGLPSGRLGAMSENLVSIYDWLRLRSGALGQNIKTLLDVMISEKGINIPELPIISGGTLTHRLPCANDDRTGLSGSMNLISTHARFTTDFMSNYAKSQDDYTLHFQSAFIYGMNTLSGQLHTGTLNAGTYYLTLSCPTCTSLITEEGFTLTRQPQYQGTPFMVTRAEECDMEDIPRVIIDPSVLSAQLLGADIAHSLYLESRNLVSILDLGQSPLHLERLSIGHLSPLPGRVIILNLWYCIGLKRVNQSVFGKYLKTLISTPSVSPTLKWLTRLFAALEDQSQLVSVVSSISPVVIPGLQYGSAREVLAAKVVSALFTHSAKVHNILSGAMGGTVHDWSAGCPYTLDTALGMAKADKPISSVVPLDMKRTNEYIICDCYAHNTLSLIMSENTYEAQLFKALICVLKPELVVVSTSVPINVIADICHVTKCIINSGGDATYVENVLSFDLCNAVRMNLNIGYSLVRLTSAMFYLTCSQDDAPKGSYLVSENVDMRPICPCDSVWTVCITRDGNAIDLSACGCLPVEGGIGELCPSLFPCTDHVYETLSDEAETLYDSLTSRTWMQVSMHGDTDWARKVSSMSCTEEMVLSLHRYLVLIRMMEGRDVRSCQSYYLRAFGRVASLSMRPPGRRIHCQFLTLVLLPKVGAPTGGRRLYSHLL
ncbi:TPA_asm: L polymerase [little skate bornavirus]|uniref:RNA-directed RNA polymerase n=1 Tax=little skate bornavirus TaxID=3055759 RepID=A0AA48P904_9MONO|nr:TPA_asm: L polymerase [little skate bornavirus]